MNMKLYSAELVQLVQTAESDSVSVGCKYVLKETVKVKGKEGYSSLQVSPLRELTYDNGITQCYLPPCRGDIPVFTPAEAGTRFSYPRGMQG